MLFQIASRCAVFAKTDLVHAQQEGFSLAEICDGLCAGLARNIVDILFAGTLSPEPIVFVGGVAKNRAVVNHIETLLGKKITVDPRAPFFGAIGAALSALAAGHKREKPILFTEDLFLPDAAVKTYFHDPLALTLSDYPDFANTERYDQSAGPAGDPSPVEVDLTEELPLQGRCAAYLGIDVGSTSTKAVLIATAGAVLAGFYTRTAGRPVAATQKILAAVETLVARRALRLSILGAGTTGSGRKFIGKIIGADLVVDEITAHARAAVELRTGRGYDYRDRRAGLEVHNAQERRRHLLRHEQCLRRGNGELSRGAGPTPRLHAPRLCGTGGAPARPDHE